MTLIDMHPPRLLLYGGMIGLVSYEFDDDKRLHAGGIQQGGYAGDDSGRVMSSSDANTNSFSASASLTTSSSPPSSPGQPSDGQQSFLIREFMNRRRKGKSRQMTEEPDNGVYFLELNSDTWKWSKPLIPLKTNGTKNPRARAEHSASKIPNSNQILFFGGWVDCPSNELWVFDFMDLEWNEFVTSGISPRARYRHTSEILNGKYYILGGSDNAEDVCDGKSYLSIHELNFETLQWYHPELRGGNPFPRSGHSSSVIGAHSIVVFGGKRSEEVCALPLPFLLCLTAMTQVFFNDIVIIDTESYSLTTVNVVENAVPSPITNASLSAIGNTCYVFGGTDLNGACFNDIRFVDLTEYLDERDITVGEGAASDYSFKILIIGDAAVGKSALLTRFSENVFLDSYTSTIGQLSYPFPPLSHSLLSSLLSNPLRGVAGIDFNSRMIRVGGSICKLEIWDTAGQERFSTITANYYRGAQGALLVYDIGLLLSSPLLYANLCLLTPPIAGRRESFEHVRSWYERAKQLGGQDIEPVLIGNKSDLSRSLVQVSLSSLLLSLDLSVPRCLSRRVRRSRWSWGSHSWRPQRSLERTWRAPS
jgi:GTPase SAR1 family protein